MDFKEKFNNLDKRSFLPLAIIVLVAVVVAVALFYFLSRDEQITVQEPPENPIGELIKSVTAPGPGEPISEETLEQISAPSDLKASEDDLKSVTAPN